MRGDLLGELVAAAKTLVGLYPIAVATSLSGLLADTGLDLDRVSRTVLEMPFDLVRHDLLMRFESPDAERVRSIADDTEAAASTLVIG